VRVDSLASRLDFDERRAQALERAVVYRPRADASAPDAQPDEGPGQRNRRLRRRRWRRGAPAAAVMESRAIVDAAPAADPPASTPPHEGSAPHTPEERNRKSQS
jgi:hypothetical protein